MSTDDFTGAVSRRTVLRIVAGSAGASSTFLRLDAATACPGHQPSVQDLRTAKGSYAPEFFSNEQMITIDCFSEILIPEDAHSPGARGAGVFEYIDGMVAQGDRAEKELWLKGIAALDDLSTATHHKPFRDCTLDQQRQVVEELAAHEDDPKSVQDRFFVAAKRATVNGYYTSEIGIHRELDYRGNGVLSEFPGCTHPDHK